MSERDIPAVSWLSRHRPTAEPLTTAHPMHCHSPASPAVK